MWEKLRVYVFQTKRAVSRMSDLVEQRRRVEEALASGAVVLEADDLSTVPLAKQGDLAMYTNAALRTRKRLRMHPDVEDGVRKVCHCGGVCSAVGVT